MNTKTQEKLAIEGGAPIRTASFPAWPVHDQREIDALVRVAQSGAWGELDGTQVTQFEQEFADFQQARHGICVVNGTAALEIIIRGLGLRHGDEVITSAYTFIATPNAALQVGAAPILVDIEPDTYLIDPAKIEEAITPRTKAIMPVHLTGSVADMDAIMDIGTRYGLPVIEDACQAWGAEWRGQRVGAIGAAGTFSFQSSKNMTAGEGGIIITNDDDLSEVIWSLHNVGRRRGGEWYEHVRVGWNCRMTEWQAAVLRVQLQRLPGQTATRDRNARYLTEHLSGIEGIRPMRRDARVTAHAWHTYNFRYDSSAFGGLHRDDFVRALHAEGIPCERGYLPLTSSEAIAEGLKALGAPVPGACPVAERACATEGVLFKQNMLLGTQEDMDSIIQAIGKIQRAKR